MDLIYRHASSDRIAVITPHEELSYQVIHQKIEGLCETLREKGIAANSKVAFVAHTTVETVLLFFALFRLKAIACPLSFRTPEEQIGAQLKALSSTHFLTAWPCDALQTDATPEISPNQLATFLFTSGTSGAPKIACHTYGNHLLNAQGALTPLQIDSSSKWLLSLPLFHVGGIAILFRMFLAGGAVVLSDMNQATHLSLVPTQLYRLLNEIPPHIRCILLGGAPIPPALLQRAVERQLPVYPSFGMTEMSSIITLKGKSLPFREVMVDNMGEIHTRGETLFQGYWNGQTIDKPNDWFATKDLGKIDAHGNLHIFGRKDRQFISGGENIQPEEIEAALLKLPGILKATVVPIDDLEFGKRPVAFIEGEHTFDTIKAHLKALLPGFKHPVKILPYPTTSEHQGIKPNLKALMSLDIQ